MSWSVVALEQSPDGMFPIRAEVPPPDWDGQYILPESEVAMVQDGVQYYSTDGSHSRAQGRIRCMSRQPSGCAPLPWRDPNKSERQIRSSLVILVTVGMLFLGCYTSKRRHQVRREIQDARLGVLPTTQHSWQKFDLHGGVKTI